MDGKTRKSTSLDYDEVLSYIGQFGRFQKKIFFLLWLSSAFSGLAVVTFVFTGYEPKYRVRVDGCEDENSTYYDPTNGEGTFPNFLSSADLLHQDCRIPEPIIEDGECVGVRYTDNKTDDIDNLVIDRTVMEYSLVEEYHFVCESKYLVPIYTSIYMGGMLAGSYIFGFISDMYGRKKALLFATFCTAASGIGGAMCFGEAGGPYFGVLRFITGVGGIGMFMSTFVLAVEHVGFKFTMLIGILIEVPFALGGVILGVEAVIFRDWRTLQLVAHCPMISIVILWFFVPESVRWLIRKGKVNQAQEIIRQIAKTNGRECPEHLFKEQLLNEDIVIVHQEATNGDINKNTQEAAGDRGTVLDLFMNWTVALRTINMCCQWFAVTMCFFGLSFASTSIPGDAFQNFIICIAIEIPGHLFCVFTMDSWGRRPVLAFSQALSGIACLICGFTEGYENLETLRILLFMVGKFGASASFALVFVYTAEMFPTIIRNQAVGVCSLVARIGGITARLLDFLKVIWVPFPVVVIGSTTFVAGIFAVFFPETVGLPLPETMEQAERIKENKRGFFTWTPVNYRNYFKEELKEVPETVKANGNGEKY